MCLVNSLKAMQVLSLSNMKKKGIAAALLTSALLLTSCGSKFADYPALYKDYFDYSIGPEYQFSKPEIQIYSDGSRVAYQNVQYYQKTLGKERSFRLTAYDSWDAVSYATFDSADTFNDYFLLQSLYPEAVSAAMHEFSDKILTNYFRDIPEFNNWLVMNPRLGVQISAEAYYILPSDDPKCIPLTKAALSPESGLQLSTASLKSIAQDKTVIPAFDIRITKDDDEPGSGIDPAPYVEIMKKMYQDYLRETESPQNYRFTVTYVHETDRDGVISEEYLFDQAALTGIGTFNASERYEATGDTVHIKIREELLDILLQQN